MDKLSVLVREQYIVTSERLHLCLLTGDVLCYVWWNFLLPKYKMSFIYIHINFGGIS